MFQAVPTRILVVDDSARNRAILGRILTPGRVIAFAASGEEALDLAASFRPDVVLLDIMMPGIDGYETCRRLRAMSDLARCKIIMVSARALVSERLAGYEAGADDYVVRPFDADELLAKIAVFCRLCSVEETDRLKNGILSLFNHATRTPLTAILSSIDLILAEPEVPASQRELLGIAREGAYRLVHYVDRLTLLTRLTSGARDEEQAIDENPAELASRAIRDVMPRAREARVGILVSLREDLSVRCVPEQIELAVSSLLDNAIRHSPPDTAVRVTLAGDEGEARLTVDDEGPGIPGEFLDRIFEGMEPPGIHDSSGGVGLSLAIARAIARRHGGALDAENRTEGGASFLLRLPCAGSASPPAPVEVLREGTSCT